jgi:hypothetical protein
VGRARGTASMSESRAALEHSRALAHHRPRGHQPRRN